jgi:hypothetical protein
MNILKKIKNTLDRIVLGEEFIRILEGDKIEKPVATLKDLQEIVKGFADGISQPTQKTFEEYQVLATAIQNAFYNKVGQRNGGIPTLNPENYFQIKGQKHTKERNHRTKRDYSWDDQETVYVAKSDLGQLVDTIAIEMSKQYSGLKNIFTIKPISVAGNPHNYCSFKYMFQAQSIAEANGDRCSIIIQNEIAKLKTGVASEKRVKLAQLYSELGKKDIAKHIIKQIEIMQSTKSSDWTQLIQLSYRSSGSDTAFLSKEDRNNYWNLKRNIESMPERTKRKIDDLTYSFRNRNITIVELETEKKKMNLEFEKEEVENRKSCRNYELKAQTIRNIASKYAKVIPGNNYAEVDLNKIRQMPKEEFKILYRAYRSARYK